MVKRRSWQAGRAVPRRGSAGKLDPRGEREHLAEAVAILAPRERGLDEVLVTRELDRLARQFLGHQAAQTSWPRRRDVIADLDRIAALSTGLAGLFERLDPAGRDALREVLGPVHMVERRPGGTIEVWEGDRFVSQFFEDGMPVCYFEPADLVGRPDRLHAWDGVPLWRRLRVAAKFARRARTRIRPDRGGNTNTFTERFGTAKGQLCRHLGELLLERAKDLGEPAALSGGEAGPLYRAAAALYTYATGDNAEEAGLERPVKDAARLLSRDEALEARYIEFGPSGPPEEVTMDIADELRTIHRQLEAL